MSRIPPLAVVLVLLAGPIALASPLAEASDAPQAYVKGFVYDEAGNPLADIVVEGRSYAPETGHEVYARNVTNAAGAFSLTLGEGKTIISAINQKTGRSAEQGIYLERDQTSEIKLVIESPPAKDALVTGVVRGLDGKPIPGARVTISSGGCCYAMAVAESEPTSDGGAASPPPATEPSADSTTSSSPTPPGDADEPRQTESRIAPIRCCYDNGYAETVTDKEGRYRLESYNGTHQLTATANNHAQTTLSVVLTSGKTVEKDFKLEKVPDETSTLEGRVVDAKTGAPISGAWVYLTNLEWSRYANAQTGRDGKFSLTTIPGWVQISIQPPCCDNREVELDAGKLAPSSPEYRGFLKAFFLADGKSTQNFELVPKAPATIVLTGYVVDPTTKKAVPDAWVNIWNQDSGDWGGARTDAAGSYKLLVRAGAHQITAYAEGYLNGADTILVESSDTLKRVDIQMPRGTSKYAACDDCYRNIAYDTAAPVPAGAAGEKSSPDSAITSEGRSESTTATRSETADGGGPRATKYEGTGGGLPPYDPDNTGTVAAAEQAATIPQLSLIGVLVAGALVALAMRRRN